MKAAISLAAAALFLVLATANAGGYRYGISDQAYYVPAVLKARMPDLFPRDSALLATQSSLLASDVMLARVSTWFHVDLPALFLAAQLATLLLLAAAATAFARRLGFSWWTTAVFLALLTIRHHIEKTGANTLEGYFHPRMLAFAFGLAAVAAILGRRPIVAALAVGAAALMHPTTAVWFAIVVGTAAFVDTPRWRRPLLAAAALAALAAVWMLTAGPLRGHLVTMDPAWIAAFPDRDYLFSSQWPLYAWAINLSYLAVIAMTYRYRRAAGAAAPVEGALVIGWLVLAVVFLATVPFEAVRLAVVVQAQVNRVFWLFDIAATAYLAWWLTRGGLASTSTRRAIVLGAAIALSATRGTYVLTHADNRRLVEVGLPDTPWTDTMDWLAGQPANWNVLTDPGHAWRYGSSVRVASAHDTVLEAGKDPALAIYDRAVALRVAERTAALEGFADFSTADMRRVGQRFGADVVITPRSHPLDLPVLHANGGFTVYDLR